MQIKFGTDGWRAIIAKEYTFENLKIATLATARYFLKHPNLKNGVAVGYDTRFMSKSFAHFVADILTSQGIKVFLSNRFLPTPAVSLFVKQKSLAGGVMITASHNPANYNGFKVKAEYGGSAHPETIAEIENNIPLVNPKEEIKVNADLLEVSDLRQFYKDYLTSELNLTSIEKSGYRIGHHAMYGAGQGIVSELLPKLAVHNFHSTEDPTFGGINPEPLPKNTEGFRNYLLEQKLNVGIINDGDADRIGMMDEKGNFIDSHKIFAVILKYLVEVKKISGEVARTYALTQVINKICEKHRLICHNLPIGFKHVGKMMTTNNILMGGEESGGIGITSHLPERDGVYIGLLVLEIMAERKKLLSELVDELYAEYGFFTYDRIDAHLTEEEKQRAILKASSGSFNSIEDMKVTKFENLDGYKYFFEGGWLLIRPSGTEPVLRLYCEAISEDHVQKALRFAVNLSQ
ncbi:MAG: phosphoglucomutase/phosphomannomutase family protein [Chloroherpetonaceae bacterium]|nr:phosphoglucomutase/phosphomannomutase family protein [Chloroherpetonaceae bacterium]